MIIYYDLTTFKDWVGPATGIPRVVEELGKALLSESPQEILPVYYSKTRGAFHHSRDNDDKVNFKISDRLISAGASWNYPESLPVIEALKSAGVVYLHLFHDLIPIKFPYFYETNFNINFAIWLKKTLEVCDVAFCVSSSTANDLNSFMQEKNIVEVPTKVVRLADSTLKNIVPRAPSVPLPPKYFLFVSTLEHRKNHQMIFDAIKLIAELDEVEVRCVLVGRPGWLANNYIEQLTQDRVLSRSILWLNSVSDSELSYVYSNALFTVFPSIYEGW